MEIHYHISCKIIILLTQQLLKISSVRLKMIEENQKINDQIRPQTSEVSSKYQQYFDVNLSKKKRIIFWIYLIALLIFVISVLSILSISFQPVQNFIKSDQYYFANQVVLEWKKGFITDIKVISSGSSCPAGYQNAFTYYWRGSGFGCNCQSSANTSFVLEAYCSPSLIQVNCTNIPSRSEQKASFWVNNSLICIKRSSVSFANEKKYDGNNKICGSSQSLVIVPISEPCPLVNISYNTFTLQNNYQTVNDVSQILPNLYASFNSTSPYSFYSYPISKFVVSQYDFCLIDDDTGINPSHYDFLLLTYPRGCSQNGNYTLIDSTSQILFYQNNPNLQTLTTLTGFPQPGNWQYNLGFSSLPSWTYRCRHNLNSKYSIQQASSKFNFNFYTLYQAGVAIIIAFTILICAQIFVLGLRRFINNSIYPIGYKQNYMPQHFCLALLRYILDFVCKLLILIFSFVLTYYSYQHWNWFKGVQNQQCHHDDVQLIKYVIIPFQNMYSQIFLNSLAILAISIVMLIVDGFHFQYIYNNQLVHYLVDSNLKLVNKQQVSNSNDRLNNDLKWLQADNVQQLGQKNDDQLRITMAQNLYGYQQAQSPVSKLKKKKKKVNSKKKDLFNNINEGAQQANMLFEDDIFGLDNSSPSSEVKIQAKGKRNLKKRK